MFSVLKKLGWFFKAYWLRYTIAIVLLLAVNVIEMFPPKLLGNAIDDMKAGAFTAEGLLFYIGIFFCADGGRVYHVLFLDASAVWRSESDGENSSYEADGAFADYVAAVL